MARMLLAGLLLFASQAFSLAVHDCNVTYQFTSLGSDEGRRSILIAEDLPSNVRIGTNDYLMNLIIAMVNDRIEATVTDAYGENGDWDFIPKALEAVFGNKKGTVTGLVACRQQRVLVDSLFRRQDTGELFSLTYRMPFILHPMNVLPERSLCYYGDVNAAANELALAFGNRISNVKTQATLISYEFHQKQKGVVPCGEWKNSIIKPTPSNLQPRVDQQGHENLL